MTGFPEVRVQRARVRIAPKTHADAVAAFVEHYNHCHYHESLDNLTLADVYFRYQKRVALAARLEPSS